MNEALVFATCATFIGIGATAFMDLVAVLRHKIFGTPIPGYAMAGRWFAHMRRGRFVHDAIAAAPSIHGERFIGWGMHYAVGVAFAALLLAIEGIGWACHPTLLPALLVGVATVAAPFLLMHPGMGAGIASCRTPNPKAARLRSVTAHATFGLGLYVAGWVLALTLPAACPA